MNGKLIDAVEHRVAKLQELEHLVIGARHLLVDLFCKAFQAGMECDLQPGKARMVGFRDRKPVNIDSHVIEKLPDLQAVFLRADRHHLMQGCFDLDSSAHKAGGNTAGQIVAFQHKHIQPFIRQHQGTRQPCQRPADHDHIIMIFIELHAVSP